MKGILKKETKRIHCKNGHIYNKSITKDNQQDNCNHYRVLKLDGKEKRVIFNPKSTFPMEKEK